MFRKHLITVQNLVLSEKISFHAINRYIEVTIIYNRYGSTGPNKGFCVLKWVKMPIS